ncbi:hypothetical protein A2967_02645 [Candidatus Daviesbacteria bacterium RIFCSPLOWO2_01_FULL_41_32]|uniref:Uncharacterized protein n=1 Tax=Candidatus Daviesbacteria bacterium RIFCSPHIGHO2_01_FULL_41_23 TaxID=1797764 RepID=A0A1F5IQI0_9BACT|nr:MAG: hypothetical protein A2871_03825 [Candidatus Daviesbacteria bacterium RIFCSPHIGHO2_01_FULL_41_23]OGE62329.1 MAG: hypothetical protein A2967_02645 [Candidatus Daviesbacteria bacterium RIFCSPLOWO2_01_FULL_41_32]
MQRGFAHIFALVGILVIILVAVEVYYFAKIKPVKNTQEATEEPIVSNVVSKQAQPTQAPEKNNLLRIPSITIDTAAKQPEFNSYSNSGFGFNYEKNSSVKEDSEEAFNKRGNGNFRKNFSGYVGYEPGRLLGAVVVLDKSGSYDINPFSVWIFENDKNLTIQQWFQDYWYYPFVWGVFDKTSKGHITLDQEATISGQAAEYKIITYQPGSPKFMYVAKDGKMYLFRIIGDAGDKILSSLKF